MNNQRGTGIIPSVHIICRYCEEYTEQSCPFLSCLVVVRARFACRAPRAVSEKVMFNVSSSTAGIVPPVRVHVDEEISKAFGRQTSQI